MQPLLGQREGLLCDGKGMRRLLATIVEDIREGYKRVEDQVSFTWSKSGCGYDIVTLLVETTETDVRTVERGVVHIPF